MRCRAAATRRRWPRRQRRGAGAAGRLGRPDSCAARAARRRGRSARGARDRGRAASCWRSPAATVRRPQRRGHGRARRPGPAAWPCRALQPTLIVPRLALDEPPDHRPSSRRALGTAASRPPEVIASHTSQRRASGTPSANVVKVSACSRLRRVPPATADRPRAARSPRRSRGPRRRAPRRRSRRRARAHAGGQAARSRSRRSARGRRRARGQPAARSLSVVMTSTRADQRGSAQPALERRRDAPAPSGLVSTSASPGRPPALVSTAAGWTTPVTASPYFGSGSSIEWPPTTPRPRPPPRRAPPRRISREHVRAERLERERDEVQRADRRGAHRVDVGQRVGRRDPPEVIGVVDDRREEVDGLDDRQLVGELGRRRVVGGRRSRRARSDRSGREARRRSARSAAADSLQPQPAPWESEVSARPAAL